MANNRLYLKCKRTGEKVFLAKYYPSTGWYVSNDELVKNLDEMFERDRADLNFDGLSHELEYETEESD